VRMPQGAGHQLGPTHSHCFEAIYMHVPGLLVAVPSTAADAKGLLKAAIRDENPVVFIEHESLYDDVYVLDAEVRGTYSVSTTGVQEPQPQAALADGSDEIPQQFTDALLLGEDAS